MNGRGRRSEDVVAVLTWCREGEEGRVELSEMVTRLLVVQKVYEYSCAQRSPVVYQRRRERCEVVAGNEERFERGRACLSKFGILLLYYSFKQSTQTSSVALQLPRHFCSGLRPPLSAHTSNSSTRFVSLSSVVFASSLARPGSSQEWPTTIKTPCTRTNINSHTTLHHPQLQLTLKHRPLVLNLAGDALLLLYLTMEAEGSRGI